MLNSLRLLLRILLLLLAVALLLYFLILSDDRRSVFCSAPVPVPALRDDDVVFAFYLRR